MEQTEEKRWRVTITYNNDANFVYDSTVPDSWTAIAVATKQMFARCIWLNPPETRITKVEIVDIRFAELEHEDPQGDSF